MRRLRWLLAPVALLAVACLAGALAFKPLALARIDRQAARYGAHASVSQISPLWLGAHLEGVTLTVDDLPSAQIRLGTIDVLASASGVIQSVAIHGGDVSLSGDPTSLRAGIRAALARARSGKAESNGRRLPIQVDELALRWEHEGQSLHASGLAIRREDTSWFIEAAATDLHRAPLSVKTTSVELAITQGDAGPLVKRLKAGEVLIRREGALDKSLGLPAASASQALPLPVPPPAPSASAPRGPRRPKNAPKEPKTAEIEPVQPATPERPSLAVRAAEFKAKMHQSAQALSLLLAPDAQVEVNQLAFLLEQGEQKLHMGPGALRVESSPTELRVSLMPAASGEVTTPLMLDVAVPLDATRDVQLKLRGGPVTLSMLGVHEGDLGLLDVQKTSIEASGSVGLSGAADRVEFDLRGGLKGLSIEHRKLSSEPVRGLDLRFGLQADAMLDGSRVSVGRGEVEVGKVQLEFSGELLRDAGANRLQAKYAIPLASCQAILEAMPPGLAPRLVGVRMAGTFAVTGKLVFDSRHPADANTDFHLMNECRVGSVPAAISVTRFRNPFRRKVYTPDGKQVEIDSGPGTPAWVSLPGISPFMEAAVLTTEDGGFRRHRGFDLEAIRNSMRENLKEGRFVRGASTISMQTAKNLYLERDKTVSRKLQEAILTLYLEQELPKEQILELYLNSIEFGPMIYGIGPAAQHYFHTTPAELSLGQALYLSSILPNPKNQHFGPDGRVTAPFMGYLHKLMRMMSKRNLIRPDELEEGLAEWVVFGQPKPARSDKKERVDPASEDSPMPDEETR
jgi:hypothetical protein